MQRRFEFMGFKIVVDENVYNPSSDSFLLAEVILNHPKVGRALELGCGCGLLSLVASKVAEQVFSYDTSVYAYRNTVKNVRINGLEGRIRVFLGDGSNGPTADLVFTNPPYLPCGPLFRQDALSSSWNGGPDGLRVFLNMLGVAKLKVKRGGTLLFVRSTLQRSSVFFSALKAKGFRCVRLADRSDFYERIEVYKCIKL